MPIKDLFTPLTLKRGPPLKNRLLLAPLTNWQSNDDGTITTHDLDWLTRCAAGGFSMVMTCAAHIHPHGQAFPGQLGIHNDIHLPGLRRLADTIRQHGGISSVQLHHGGARVDPALIDGATPVGPSDLPTARGLSLSEIETLKHDFIAAALRAQHAGFDGVEVHAAFGWILTQFISPVFNHRTDHYGGSLENRSHLLFEVIDGIRSACRSDFQIGLRISMERYGLSLAEMQWVAGKALKEEVIDYLDLAVWDYRKQAQEEGFEGRSLVSVFTDLPRSAVRVGASGHVMTAEQAVEVLDAGCDFVMLGKAAILEPDFPRRVEGEGKGEGVVPGLPVTAQYLRENSGLGERFIDYLRTWDGFVRG